MTNAVSAGIAVDEDALEIVYNLRKGVHDKLEASGLSQRNASKAFGAWLFLLKQVRPGQRVQTVVAETDERALAEQLVVAGLLKPYKGRPGVYVVPKSMAFVEWTPTLQTIANQLEAEDAAVADPLASVQPETWPNFDDKIAPVAATVAKDGTEASKAKTVATPPQHDKPAASSTGIAGDSGGATRTPTGLGLRLLVGGAIALAGVTWWVLRKR